MTRIQPPTNLSKSQQQAKIAKTIYRQLLRWCNATGSSVPFDTIPPLTLQPPHHINRKVLRDMSFASAAANSVPSGHGLVEEEAVTKMTRLLHELPPGCAITDHKLTCPVGDVSDVRSMVRVLYRLNGHAINEEEEDASVIQKRVSLAFEGLRSLKDLSVVLEERKKRRSRHEDRTGVLFHVGQVVRHKPTKWRGIVVRWDRTPLTEIDADGDTASSNEPGYDILLDSGDLQKSTSGKTASLQQPQLNTDYLRPSVPQSELEVLPDGDSHFLNRIRNDLTDNYFKGLDFESGRFVPNDKLAYEYPTDRRPSAEGGGDDDAEDVLAVLSEGVRDAAAHIHRAVSDSVEDKTVLDLDPLSPFLKKLHLLAFPPDDDLIGASSNKKATPPQQHVTALRSFLQITRDLYETQSTRRENSLNKDSIRFPLGTIVKHQKYDFRGVIVGWDRRPIVDVSRWDGLQHLTNVGDMPFYHVVTDRHDCMREFGNERPFRYVAEENLAVCPKQQSVVDCPTLDTDDWWLDPKEWTYVPPPELSYKYAEDAGNSEEEGGDIHLLQAMNVLEGEILRIQLTIQKNDFDKQQPHKLPKSIHNLSLDNLHKALSRSQSLENSFVLEESIKEIWRAHPDTAVRSKFDRGVKDLIGSKLPRALSAFNAIVKNDSTYYEAYNMKATAHFMLGDMDASMDAVKEVLLRNPSHFMGVGGCGLVCQEQSKIQEAVEHFRKCLQINPWSPISSRLASCLDLLEKELESEDADEDKGDGR